MDNKTPVDTYDPLVALARASEEVSEPSGVSIVTEMPSATSAYRPASPQERFAAFFTDALFFFFLLAGWGMLLKALTGGDITRPFSYEDQGWVLFGTTGAALYFLYYFLFEAVMSATPGKFLGGITVHRRMGGTPSLLAIFIRNVLRFVDFPLFFVTGIGFMEATRKHQRLGDLLAGTVVMREMSFESRRVNPDLAAHAGATRRTLAFLLDLPFLIAFSYGALLLIPVSKPLAAMVALNLLPIVLLLFPSLSESLFQTTFGKALLRMKVTQEDGRPPRFSGVLVRNLFRLFDTNPVGYLCAFLSTRKQRPGDIAAGTVVLKSPPGLRGWLAVPFMLVLAGLVGTLGLRNSDSFVKKHFHVRVGPVAFQPVPPFARRFFLEGVQIENLELAYNENEISRDRNFSAGQVIYLVFRTSGYYVDAGKAWFQADIRVQDQHRNVLLDVPNVINSSVVVGNQKTAKLVTRFALHPQATEGPYTVTLTLRDMFGNRKAEETLSFKVR